MLPYFYLDAWNSIEAGAYSPVMITEMLCFVCVVLLVVVICCMIILYNMIKIIRPSGNERARVEYARENQRVLPVEREPTVSFPRVEESARQLCTSNNTTYGGLQAIRRQPQMHDERFRRQRKKNLLCLMQNLKVKFVFFSSLPWTILCFVVFLGFLRKPGVSFRRRLGAKKTTRASNPAKTHKKNIHILFYVPYMFNKNTAWRVLEIKMLLRKFFYCCFLNVHKFHHIQSYSLLLKTPWTCLSRLTKVKRSKY